MTIATSATPHLFWITSRAAGIVSLVLASLAVSIGLVMSLKMMRSRRPDMLALHEVLSLGTLVALAVHGLTLIGDHVLSPTLADVALPFAWSYKTVWTSIGIIGGWALVFLGLSYYARQAIGADRAQPALLDRLPGRVDDVSEIHHACPPRRTDNDRCPLWRQSPALASGPGWKR